MPFNDGDIIMKSVVTYHYMTRQCHVHFTQHAWARLVRERHIIALSSPSETCDAITLD